MPEKPPDQGLILIAERDQNVRGLQHHFLEQAGFAVEFVDDGQTAFERAVAIRPAVVVAEILIPKVDGLTLCRRLREEPATADMPIIIFSILAAATRASDAGADAFLRKPLVESVFVTTIQEMIAARSNGNPEK